jgi:spore maturation protein CgeB
MNMRILIYGQPWREGMPASLAAALRALGHEVDLFDFTAFLYHYRIGARWAHALDLALSAEVAYRINRSLRQRIEGGSITLMIFCSDAHIWPDTLSRAVSKCPMVVSWKFDEPFNRKYATPATLELFRRYSVIFTPRAHLIEEYRARGAQCVHHLPFCVDPGVHYPVSPSSDQRKGWGADVVFVGTWSRRRESLISSLPNTNVNVWGYSWRHATRRTKSVAGLKLMNQVVTGQEMSLVFNASKIALNFLTPEQRDRTNVRNLEIPACGGFQLCERTEEIQALFHEGKEVACFGTIDELKDKVTYYLRHATEREAIARASYERLQRLRSTYADRAQQLLAYIAQPR